MAAHFLFLIFWKNGEINLNFWVEFQKYEILHFPTNRHPWDCLVSDLHDICIQIRLELFSTKKQMSPPLRNKKKKMHLVMLQVE